MEGEPETGDTFESMKEAKRQYLYAVRRNKRRNKYLQNEKMAQAVNRNSSRDFWKEHRRMKQHKVDPPHIDNIHSPRGIAGHLRNKYQTLYNENEPDPENIRHIEHFIENNIQQSEYNDYVVTEEDIVKAMKDLKNGKADGNTSVISDHIKYAPRRLCTILGILLTTAGKYGHMPDDMLLSTVISIPKDRNDDMCSGDNYRGISLSSALAKIHDIIILTKYHDVLATSDMQYAFKAGHSTTMCTLALKDVIKYYQWKETDVYAAFLDASKAFDRVKHDKLFMLLIDRCLPPIIIRTLYDSYKRQKLQVQWNRSLSRKFGTKNGIKQGSILSPVLFTVYMDELLSRLEKGGYGCRVGTHYFGGMGYADDLALICPTLGGLQEMTNICEDFGDEYGMLYNPKKSVGIYFISSQQKTAPPRLRLAGESVKWVDQVRHLGNILTKDLKENSEVSHKRGDFIGRVNSVIVTYPKAPDEIICELFNTQCTHLYGCEAWTHSDPAVSRFYTTWNSGVRRLLNLPYNTHTRFLTLFVNKPHVQEQIFKRFYKMMMTMSNSTNKRLAHITRRMAQDPRSIIGKNLHIMSKVYGFNIYQLRNGYIHVKNICKYVNDEDACKVAMIQELRDALAGCVLINDFNREDLEDIIYDICTF